MGYLVSNTIVLFNMLLELTHNALPDVLRKMIQTRQSLSKNVNNVLVTSSWLGSVMGVMASMVTMIEGINILRKGLYKQTHGSELAYIYIIGGGLQIVAGSLALIQGLGLLAFLGPIGIGLYFLSLIAGIVSGFILWKFEDKSDSWDELQIWLNRCLVGNWRHHDKGLPYPPSFPGMAHSGNDYLIAMMGVKANIEIEREDYLYRSLPIYQSGKARYHVTNQGQGGVIGIKQAMRALYIVMKFSRYKKEVSDFEGTVRIAQKSANGAYGIVTLSVAKGRVYPIVTLQQQLDKDSFFVQRGEPLEITESKYDFEKNRVGREEAYNEAIDKKTKQQLGYYEILYKVGEFFIMREGKVQIYYKLKYWHDGRTTQDKNGNPIENKPILLSYSYDI